MSCGILGAITGSEVAGLTGAGAGFGRGAGASIAGAATGTTEGTTGTYCWLCSNTRLGWVTGAAGATLSSSEGSRDVIRSWVCLLMGCCSTACGSMGWNGERRPILYLTQRNTFRFASGSLADVQEPSLLIRMMTLSRCGRVCCRASSADLVFSSSDPEKSDGGGVSDV